MYIMEIGAVYTHLEISIPADLRHMQFFQPDLFHDVSIRHERDK